MPELENTETKLLLSWSEYQLNISTQEFEQKIVGIQFDAVVSEFFSRSGELSSHPRAGDFPIYDNYVANPVTVSIEAEVTNTPVIPATTHMGDVTGSKQLVDLKDIRKYGGQYEQVDPGLASARLARNLAASVGNELPLPLRLRPDKRLPEGANLLVFDGAVKRVVHVFSEIQRLMDQRIPLTLALTNFKNYPFENMYITQFQSPYEPDTGDAMIVRLDFEQSEVSQGAQSSRKSTPTKKPQHKPKPRRRPKPVIPKKLSDDILSLSRGQY